MSRNRLISRHLRRPGLSLTLPWRPFPPGKLLILAFTLSAASCKPVSYKAPSHTHVAPVPASDPTNTQGWILNQEISDEFAGDEIDRSKWFVQGDYGDYYIWKGRAPSQFAAHNILVQDGYLKIRTQWEPEFEFAQEEYAGNRYGWHDDAPMPVTTGGIISKKRFLHGYMEVRSKAGHAAMTSAFWAIGYQSELDVYELMGNPKATPHIKPNDFLFSIHDWRPEAVMGQNKVFTHAHRLPHPSSEAFHIYGAEWGEGYVKFYLDGELVYEVFQSDLEEGWVLTNPMEIWLDSEIFTWQGLPHEEELPVEFQVDYMRVWQKPSSNFLDEAFYGFEGPMLYESYDRPLKMVPEDTRNNRYQRFWQFDETNSNQFAITADIKSSGQKSLRINSSEFSGNSSLRGPKGSLALPEGNFTLTLRVMKDAGSTIDSIEISTTRPKQILGKINIAEIDSDQWQTVSIDFKQTSESETIDSLVLTQTSSKEGGGSVYVDDIKISPKPE